MRNSFHHFGRSLVIVGSIVLGLSLCQGCAPPITKIGPITGKEYQNPKEVRDDDYSSRWVKIPDVDPNYKISWPEYDKFNKGLHGYYRELGLSRYLLDYPYMPEAHQKRVLKGEVWVGMPKDLVMIALGFPWNVHQTFSATSHTEMWSYGNIRLYFENGEVTFISKDF